MLRDDEIGRLEDTGFRRWTKGDMDRLYIDATALGLDCQYKRDHEPCLGTWQDREVSNADCRRIYYSKVWIDVEDGSLHVTSDFQPGIGGTSVEDAARRLVLSVIPGKD